MTALTFTTPDPATGLRQCLFAEGRLVLQPQGEDGISPCLFALATPVGMSPEALAYARLKTPAGTAEHDRLAQTLPGPGAEIGWFVSAEDGAALLAEAAACEDLPDAETQLSAAGFKPYLCEPNGRKCYVRRTGRRPDSNAFHLAVSPDAVRLTYERPSTVETLLVLHRRRPGRNGPVHTALPGFLDSVEALVAVAIGQVRRYPTNGRRPRRAA